MRLFYTLLTAATLAFAGSALAQDEEDVPPPPKSDGVRIVFLPPPMNGTLSMGIYDGKGKLVRVLHREATEKDFTVGVNGFITHWDGRDDAGKAVPAGKYEVRGWSVGDLGIEGVAFHGNDWVKDDTTPRPERVVAVKAEGRDAIHIVLRDTAGKEQTVGWNLAKEGVEPPADEVEVQVENGALFVIKGDKRTSLPMAVGEKGIALVPGAGDAVWAIVQTAQGREVRSYSAAGEFLRRLAYAESEPQPVQIAASRWGDMIFLLEENAATQRLRALSLVQATAQPEKPDAPLVRAWQTVYEKRVAVAASFEAVAGAIGRSQPVTALPEARIVTKPNPLLDGKKTEARLKLVVDAKGALLKTSDGLPLVYLSDVPGLRWAAFAREKGEWLYFQGDAAVVEEFKLKRLENLMAFDAGEYELRR